LNWRRELKPMNLLLLAGIAFLLVAIIQIWWTGSNAPTPAPSAQGPQVPKAPILRDQQPLSAFRIVVAKNLFSQERQHTAEAIGNVEDSLEGRHLLGTMTIGTTKAAIIGPASPGRGKGTAEVEAVYLGEEWHGFKVLEISNDSVTFAGKDGKKTLKFPE
jgi:hypothetical protein